MLAATLLLAWIPVLSAQVSHATKQYSLSIPRSALAVALDEFSKQTRLQIGAELQTREQKDRVVGPVEGVVTADEALKQLLDGSDLSFRWEDEYTIRIFPGIVKPRSAENISEVLVTGTRISGGEGPAPVRVFGHQRIERYGVSTLPSLTKYFTQQPFSFSEGYQQSGAQHFQMRGLGFDTTLVLINGRRAPPSANSILVNAFDLNTIPLTAVDRVEVMSDSASAIYGADAIGGVVNIILKKEIETPEVYLHFGGADGGGVERRVAAAVGNSGASLKSSLVLDYFEHDPLIGEDRDLWRNQDFTRFGGQDYRVSTANPGNIYSLTGRPLPGLPSSFTAVPTGSSGVGLTPADFNSTAGTRNLESAYKDRSIAGDVDRATAFGSVELALGKRSWLFGEVLAVNSDVVGQRTLPTLTREIVPGSNPFNPFGEAVAVDYSFEGMDPIGSEVHSDLLRLVAGARGNVLNWDWELAGVRSEEDVTQLTVNELDRARVLAAVNSSDRNTALNLFRDGAAGSDELLNSLVGEARKFSFSSASTQISGFVRGSLFQVPAGNGEFVVGGEWRRESVEFFEALSMAEERAVSSAFVELKVPLLDELSMTLALRSDRYQNLSDASNPQYGLVWRPANDWLFRASYGTSFRPPSLFELYTPQLDLPVPVADPKRGGAVSTVKLTVGGNSDLDVITARSFTAGFVFTPSSWSPMRIASSYWRVVMDNRIIVPPIAEILQGEDRFPDRIIRSAPTVEDTLAGRPGAVQSLDISRLNYGRLDTSGVDVDVSYLAETSIGCFSSTLTATWIHDYSAQDMNSVLPADRVGIANAQGTIPRWRAVGTLAWKVGGFGAATTVTHTPEYQDSNQKGLVDRQLPARTLVDLQAWLELGAVLSGDSLMSETKLTLGMLNLLDEAPDFAEAGLVAGYDVSQADLTQRFVYLRFSKAF